MQIHFCLKGAGLLLCLLLISTPFAHGAYYGKRIQSGWGAGATNDLAGTIYAVDEDTFQVIGFVFDSSGAGENASFLLGTVQSFNDVGIGEVDDTAQIIADPTGQLQPLRSYNAENIQLELPSGKTFDDITYIAVGDRNTKKLFGGASIANGFDYPAPRQIGKFTGRAHGVSSGQVTVLNERMIEIKSLRYDGQGPDAFFYVGVTDDVEIQNSPYGKIPDENGNIERKAQAYSDKDIILMLPDTISVIDLKWLSIYCISYEHNFGEVTFPSDLNVPPYTEIEIDRTGLSCVQLSDDLQVSWKMESDVINFELAGRIDRNKDYMAFGLSGSQSTFLMTGADVVVTDWKEDREPRAVDYYLSSYAQCADNGGVCPDTSTFNSANDDAMMVTGIITQGIVRIKFQRALVTADVEGNKDQAYINGTKQQVVWAVGPLNTKDEAAKHYVGGRIDSPLEIDFGREPTSNCEPFRTEAAVEKPDFLPNHIYGSQTTVFTAEIGQAGSEQGYLALTGLPSWGIAWYINGILVPELHLKRGVEYTFRVAGGTDPNAGAKYHPLYFTDDPEGGFAQTNNGTIYPGTVNGQSVDYAVGGYCEWKLTAGAVGKSADGYVYPCFKEFQNDLYLDCDPDSDGYTDFKFTPDSSTPDTLYYQCYTHKNLGWKIHVYDTLPAEKSFPDGCLSATAHSFTVSMFSLLLSAVIYIALM